MANEMIGRVYAATSQADQQATYDAWAAQYERDLFAMGYRVPQVTAAVFARFVGVDVAPILDAGCGSGLQAEPLHLLGYRGVAGVDLSEGMLDVARAKRIYASLQKMALGDGLDFPDGAFGAVISCGAITPGHAPASSFRDLAQVTRQGGRIVFSLRSDPAAGAEYWAVCEAMEQEGVWRRLFSSEPYPALPYTEPDILCRAHVFERQ